MNLARFFYTESSKVLIGGVGSANWYLFAYSRFVYFRPKSGALPTHKKKIDFGHQCDVKVMSRQHPVGLCYLGHVKVTSSARTGFVCTKSCN